MAVMLLLSGCSSGYVDAAKDLTVDAYLTRAKVIQIERADNEAEGFWSRQEMSRAFRRAMDDCESLECKLEVFDASADFLDRTKPPLLTEQAIRRKIELIDALDRRAFYKGR